MAYVNMHMLIYHILCVTYKYYIPTYIPTYLRTCRQRDR